MKPINLSKSINNTNEEKDSTCVDEKNLNKVNSKFIVKDSNEDENNNLTNENSNDRREVL